MSTPLFARTMKWAADDPDGGELMRDVWGGTPWMIEVFTGSGRDERYSEIIQWCFDELGDEAHPFSGDSGAWRSGNATVCGWTWFGFDTEDRMTRFLDAWPQEKKVA